MSVMYTSSEREEKARDELYRHNRELRGALLDVLSLLHASSDPWAISTDVQMSEPERLRRQALSIEHRDAIIHRAREIVDRTRDLRHLRGKLPSETQDSDLEQSK